VSSSSVESSGLSDYTPAFPATAARQTLNSLFAVLVGVAEINPAIHTGVRVFLKAHPPMCLRVEDAYR
jgi:hypothetical protein